MSSPDACEGDTVCFLEDARFRFGTMLTVGHKWGRVRVAGSVQKVLLIDIKAWPPERVGTPAKQVKRGGA